MPIINHGDTNVSLLDHSLSDGLHVCSDWADCPPGLTDSQGTCFVITYLHYEDLGQYWGKRIYFPTNDRAVYINDCTVSKWYGWEPIAAAVPPQEYDVPFASGFETYPGYSSKYFKNYAGEVTINFLVKRSDDESIQSEAIFGTLPVGFRPGGTVAQPVLIKLQNNLRTGGAYVEVWPDGRLRFVTDQTTVHDFGCSITYLASS